MRFVLITTLLVALFAACEQVDFTAPGGSTLTLVAQPKDVDINGTSTLTVTGIRATGAPLPNGTVVRFTVADTNGSVFPNPIELRNGVGVVQFTAGQQIGDAIVTAFSGDATVDATISIGKRLPDTIILTADPSNLPIGGGKTKLRAFVFDENGSPIARVKVFFQTDKGTLSSGGQPVITDASGLAKDTLTTVETANVTASTSNGITANITIEVTTGQAPTCSFVVSPSTTVTIGEDVLFFDNSNDPDGQIVQSTWDFGDGGAAQGLSATHSYNAAGTFFVIHTVTDNTGFTDTCDPVTITVTEPAS